MTLPTFRLGSRPARDPQDEQRCMEEVRKGRLVVYYNGDTPYFCPTKAGENLLRLYGEIPR